MTAATTDVQTKDGGVMKEVELQLAASQTIYEGTMVCRNAAGKGIPGSNATPTNTLAGVSKGDKRNGTSTVTSGASDTLYVSLYTKGVYRFAASGLAITDIGKPVYLADDKTIQLLATNVFAGYLRGIDSASLAWVEIDNATRYQDEVDEEQVVDVPVAAAMTIVVSTMVGIDATGYLTPANDSTCVKFYGVALEGVDNSGGSDGDLNCQVDRSTIHQFVAAGLTQADVGKPVWVSNATTVTLTPGNVFTGCIERTKAGSVATAAIVNIAGAIQEAGTTGNVPRGKLFTIPFVHIGACGTGPINIGKDIEVPHKYKVLRGFVNALTAPGGAYVMTASLSDGTSTFSVTITGSAVSGETKTAGAVPFKADFDTDITVSDDDASGATADISGFFICEEL